MTDTRMRQNGGVTTSRSRTEQHPLPSRAETRRASRALAYMTAEGAMWLATGNVFRDEREPIAHLLNRLDAAVPAVEHFDWLRRPHPELGHRTPMALIETDDLDPLLDLLKRMPQREHPPRAAVGGPGR